MFAVVVNKRGQSGNLGFFINSRTDPITQLRGKVRMGAEDYKKEGRKFYRLAAEHPSARELNLSDVFWTLHEDFPKAKKPLNFIAEHYLRHKRYKFFS